MLRLILFCVVMIPALVCGQVDDRITLIGDDAETTAVLRNVTRVLPGALGRLRDAPGMPRVPVLGGDGAVIASVPPPIRGEMELLRGAMDRLLAVTAREQPQLLDAAMQTAEKARRQIAYLESDHAVENWRSYRTTLSLLSETMGEFELLAEYLLLEAGETGGVEILPQEWMRSAPADEEFRRRIVPWTSARLLDEATRRHALAVQRDQPRGMDPQALVEVSELARELARRAAELPPSAQLGFRDTALRLDVQAKTLLRLLREDNRSHWRRQATQMGQTIVMLRTWLEMQGPELPPR